MTASRQHRPDQRRRKDPTRRTVLAGTRALPSSFNSDTLAPMMAFACSRWLPTARLSLMLGLWSASGMAAHGPVIGQPAPPLIAPTVDGGTVDLAALRGHVVLLNLWASWCPPCRAELPMLAQLQERHRAEGLVLIALSADRHHDREDARRAITGLALTGAFMDGAKPNGYANPEALPFTYVIDADGIVRAIFAPSAGPLGEIALENAIAPLLHPTTP